MRWALGKRPCLVILAVTVYLSIFCLFHGAATAGLDEPAVPAADLLLRESVRDSLRMEILHYRNMIRSLSDSLVRHDPSSLDDRWLADVEMAVGSLGEAISSIADQLSAIQIEIDAGRFSLRDGQGGRVTLDFPKDLSERLSQGFASITRVILDEIPDTLHTDNGHTSYFRHWNERMSDLALTASQPENLIRGDIIKFNDDLTIAAADVVEGNVVAILGDVVVKGRIQGDLVVILGNVELQDGAAVDGAIVHVLGRFGRHDEAQTGGTTVRVIDLGEDLFFLGRNRHAMTWASFWAWQAMFVFVLCLVLLLLALLPRWRRDGVAAVLDERPAGSLGLGLLLVGFGHVAVVGLSALLVLTVIGIPIALLMLLALALLDLAAVGVASLGIGRRTCAALGVDCRRPWKAVLLGMLVLHAPAFLAGLGGITGLPLVLITMLVWIGRACKLAALAAGLGAMLLGRFGTHGSSREVIQTTELAPELTRR